MRGLGAAQAGEAAERHLRQHRPDGAHPRGPAAGAASSQGEMFTMVIAIPGEPSVSGVKHD